jgi:8-oxo-dGTP pyrophosphatase MutT (NUDIX family)
MVRHNYGKRRWTLPGGRIEKNENPSDAVRREVKEELGIIVSDVRSLGEFLSTLEYKRDYIYCFCAITNNLDIKIDPNEIYEASWFPINNIPEDRAVIASKILRMYNPHNF